MKDKKILKQVKDTIKKAGEAAMEYYGEEKEADVHYKDPQSPVTKADLAAEKVILEDLKEFDYGILSEESDSENSRLDKKRVWIIDPLDGTKDFLQQTGEFTIMIGLAEEGESILGAVYAPAKKKLYFASSEEGAYLQKGEQEPMLITVSSEDRPAQMQLLVSRNHLRQAEQKTAESLGIGEMVPCGSAGLKICRIAEGREHLYINSSDKTGEWDICAADIILTEAEGELTDARGDKIKYNKKNTKNKHGYIASNSQIHTEVVEELTKHL